MPELPEVETFRAVLEQELCGRAIESVDLRHPAIVGHPSPEAFVEGLNHRAIEAVGRRGKFLILHLAGESDLVCHLRMTGRLLVTPHAHPAWPHTHAVLHLSDGRQLRFADQRRFGRLWLRRAGELDTFTGIARLGPEPFETAFDAAWLEERLSGRQRAIKTCLLDQSLVAGIGNIYADEILFAARLHPEQPAASLTRAHFRRLAALIPAILARAVDDNRVTPEAFLQGGGTEYRNTPLLRIYGHEGDPCPRCHSALRRLTVGGRSSCHCPKCQRFQSENQPSRQRQSRA